MRGADDERHVTDETHLLLDLFDFEIARAATAERFEIAGLVVDQARRWV